MGAPPRPRRARYGRYGVHESLSFLFPGRVSAPSHPLDGRETAIPPAERARSALRCRRGMQFPRRTRTPRPQARARRAARRRCADPHDYRRQSSNCTARPQARVWRAARLRCADPLALRSPGRGFGRTGSHRGGVNFPGNALHPTGAIMGLYCDLVQFFLISAPVGCLHISRKGTYARFRNKISGLLK